MSSLPRPGQGNPKARPGEGSPAPHTSDYLQPRSNSSEFEAGLQLDALTSIKMIRQVRILMLLVCAHSCKRLALDPRGLQTGLGQIWLISIFILRQYSIPSFMHSFTRTIV